MAIALLYFPVDIIGHVKWIDLFFRFHFDRLIQSFTQIIIQNSSQIEAMNSYHTFW